MVCGGENPYYGSKEKDPYFGSAIREHMLKQFLDYMFQADFPNILDLEYDLEE